MEARFLKLEQLRISLDERELSLKNEIIEIRKQRNQAAPISILPVEVLCKIFIICRDIAWHDNSYGLVYMVPSRSKWKTVTHICQYWRAVALGCQELWSALTPSLSSKWTQAMIERSRSGPVSITGFDCERHSEENKLVTVLKALGPASHQRWSSIQLMLRTSELGGDIGKHFIEAVSSAPSLVNLSLDATVIHYEGAKHSLPEGFLAGNAPLLRTLQISGWHLPWSSNLLTQRLDTLKLMIPSLAPCPSPQRFAEILLSATELHHLHLDMQFPDLTLAEDHTETFEFPRLVSLSVGGDCKELADFLRYVCIPSSTSLKIKSKTSQAALPELRTAIDRVWVEKPKIGFMKVHRSSSPNIGVTMSAYNSKSGKDDDCRLSVALFTGYKRHDNDPPTYVCSGTLLSFAPWERIQTLAVTIAMKLNAADGEWLRIFEVGKGVKDLYLMDEAVPEFIGALTHFTKVSLKAQTDNLEDFLRLPCLESITITAVEVLYDSDDRDQNDSNEELETFDSKEFLSFLHLRVKELGVPLLKKISFDGCYGVSGDVIDMLENQEEDLFEDLDFIRCHSRSANWDEDEDDEEDYCEYDGYGFGGFGGMHGGLGCDCCFGPLDRDDICEICYEYDCNGCDSDEEEEEEAADEEEQDNQEERDDSDDNEHGDGLDDVD